MKTIKFGNIYNSNDAILFRVAADIHGYNIIEIRTGEKACKVKEWQRRAAKPLDVNRPRPGYLNTGILCAGLRVPDIDCDHPDLVEKLEEAARCCLGHAPLRFRDNSPRVAMMYRAAEGEPRKRVVTSRSFVNLDGKPVKVEVLGAGQFVLAHGIHPSGARLEWEGGSPADTPIEDLPPVSEAQITDFLKAAAQLIDAEDPPPVQKLSASPLLSDPLGLGGVLVAGGPVSVVRLECMLDQIGAHPSRPFHDYDSWVRELCLPVAGMIRRGQIGRDEGVALIKRVSERHG